ncbi:TetR/AcrR family transcriptional regulator [Williamsia limnetica]|nr:TetR/AcrR family transcriptional regulator [Williamsia limnetica]
MTTDSSAPDTTRRVRLEADDRRAQMINAAMTVFAGKPYESVSTEELARAAGTTRTNLNYHFGNKRNLYLEALTQFATLPSKLPRVALDGPVEAGVDRLFERWLDLVERNRETFMVLMHAQRAPADDVVSGIIQGSLAAWEDRLLAVLGLPEDDSSARARMRAFQAMVGAATEEWLATGNLSKQQVQEMLTGALLALGRADRAAS